MTLPPDPTLFLAHCKAHKAQPQSQPYKELKMPTHYPPTSADRIFISFILPHQQITALRSQLPSCKSLFGKHNVPFLIYSMTLPSKRSV
jgi:hypothetical protein